MAKSKPAKARTKAAAPRKTKTNSVAKSRRSVLSRPSEEGLAVVGGVAAGAAAGSFLGPVGAAVGAVVGGVAGSRIAETRAASPTKKKVSSASSTRSAAPKKAAKRKAAKKRTAKSGK